ncbi:hypothetical protein E2562_016739 [Oryza meyeriana var. granulata]|uniref:Uncharacterized protein n=1 Tax=Oryza meyeriana var. granulata TaxID=110450 RepID=A0A6G1BX70_9ORYZ|nr:hypothetical protein E2562_016739 [Oryza meyeriana var. granulata]
MQICKSPCGVKGGATLVEHQRWWWPSPRRQIAQTDPLLRIGDPEGTKSQRWRGSGGVDL